MSELLLQGKEHRQGDQSHVLMPARPTTHLILRHAHFAFSLLDCTFDPVALVLTIAVLLYRAFTVGQAVLDRSGAIATDNQAAGSRVAVLFYFYNSV